MLKRVMLFAMMICIAWAAVAMAGGNELNPGPRPPTRLIRGGAFTTGGIWSGGKRNLPPPTSIVWGGGNREPTPQPAPPGHATWIPSFWGWRAN
jgi:hypothetical protein